MSESPYNFKNTTGDVTGQFKLFAKAKSSGIEDIASADNVSISYLHGQLKVESCVNNPIININVFNVVGGQINGFSNLNLTDYAFNLSNDHAVIIVKVQTAKGIKTEKIVLR